MSAALESYLFSAGPVTTALLKATVLLVLAWAAHLALHRASPRWRVLLWRATAVALAALPLLMLALPVLRVQVMAPEPAAPAVQAPLRGAPAVGSVDNAPARGGRARPWLAAMLWAVGLALVAARTVVGHGRVRCLLSASRPAPEAAAGEFRAVASRVGCRRSVAFRTAAGLGSPMLVGLWRPVVLLPEDVLSGARCGDLDGIVAHELAHLRSHDLAWAYALHWLSAVLWFHPLTWGIGRAHGRACEMVSDAVSAGCVGCGRAYARILARAAVGMRAARPAPAGMALAGRSEIGGRLAALRRGLGERRLPLTWVIAACLLATGVTGGLSALIFTHASRARAVMTEYGPVSSVVAQAMAMDVTLAPPYPASHEGGRTDMISVQYAVLELSHQVGLGFRWSDSYPGAYPASAALVRPDIRGLTWREAMRKVVEPVGLTFGIRDGGVVLRPADGAALNQ